MTRLAISTLASASQSVRPIGYDRNATRIGIVHLGIGAFHRAHQADYFDQLLARGETDWAILGASLRSPGVRDQLAPQDGLYTLVVRDGQDTSRKIIGAVRDVMVAPEDPYALVAAMAAPSVRLVTLTITEKGYKIDPATGALLWGDLDLASDLQGNPPKTAIGLIVEALSLRRAAGLRPFTVLSCDNLPANGERTRSAVLAFSRQRDPALADWIEARGAFPSSMVDRIVPATTQQDVADLANEIGLDDLGMVKTEPFSQWVIEDRFADGRPSFEQVGVQMTDDVELWEHAKLRLLNGAHSSLAYLGRLAGLEYVHEAIAREELSRFLDLLWDEAAQTLIVPQGLDVQAYRSQLRARFSNSALQHRTYQIAMDGSQKLPQRLLQTVADRIAAGARFKALALGVAGWMRWQLARDEAGHPYEVQDPLAAETANRLKAAPETGEAIFDALIGLESVFGPDLASSAIFRTEVVGALNRLLAVGALRAAGDIAMLKESMT